MERIGNLSYDDFSKLLPQNGKVKLYRRKVDASESNKSELREYNKNKVKDLNKTSARPTKMVCYKNNDTGFIVSVKVSKKSTCFFSTDRV